jgi:ATP-dependent Lon protease
MQVAKIELYKILKTKFTESEAESIIFGLEHKVASTFEDRKSDFALKEDMHALRREVTNDIHALRAEIKEDIHALRTEIKEDMHALHEKILHVEAGLREDMAKMEIRMSAHKADTIKWMFIFWLGQLASFIAIAKFIFHQ